MTFQDGFPLDAKIKEEAAQMNIDDYNNNETGGV